MKDLRFGITTDCFGGNVSLPRAMERLVRLGYTDVEIVPHHLAEESLQPPTVRNARKKLVEIRNQAADLGINLQHVHGPYSGADLVADGERARKHNVAVWKKWIDLCQVLDARVLIIHPGGRQDSCPTRDLTCIREKNLESISQLVRHAGRGSLRIAVENVVSRSMRQPNAIYLYGTRMSDLKDILATLKSDRLGICLDTGHADIEKMDVAAAVKEAGRDLIATHLHENNGVDDLHMFPFSLRAPFSRMDWRAIFRAFKEIGYPYPLIGECVVEAG